MKKMIAACMCFILAAGLVTGCAGKPGEKATLNGLAEMYGDEKFEIIGDKARSLDRDLEFEYWYDYDGPDIWPDVELPFGGKYHLYTSYETETHHYWNAEYRSCIDRCGFAEVDYGRHADNEEECAPNLLYIFIGDDASAEDRGKVESLFFDLREICQKEEEFRNSGGYSKFGYMINLWYFNKESGEFRSLDNVKIKADSKDEELNLDNIKEKGPYKTDPRKILLDNGKAKITVN